MESTGDDKAQECGHQTLQNESAKVKRADNLHSAKRKREQQDAEAEARAMLWMERIDKIEKDYPLLYDLHICIEHTT